MAPWWNRRRDPTGRRALDSTDAETVTEVALPEPEPDAAAPELTEDELPAGEPSTVDEPSTQADAADIGEAIAALRRVAERSTFGPEDVETVLFGAEAADDIVTPPPLEAAEPDDSAADPAIEPPVDAEHAHVLTPWPPRPVGDHRPRRSTATESPQPGDELVLAESWPTYPWNETDLHPQTLRKESTMSALSKAISDLLAIEGATGAAIVDYESGMALASGGDPGFNLDVAAAGNSNVVRAKLSTMNEIGLKDQINDILITLGTQYHLVNVLADDDQRGLFIYLVLNKSNANLALARHKLSTIARAVTV